MFRSIRFKLSLVIFLLLAFVTTASAAIVMNVMDRFIFRELVKKGFSIGQSAATAAGYSLLKADNLALDNLTSKIKESQEDVLFVAAVDNSGIVAAHSEVSNTGKPFPAVDGELLINHEEGSMLRKTFRADGLSYEFQVPISFAGKKLGDIYLAIDADTLVRAQADARRNIILVSVFVLALGVVGTFVLSGFITTPIKRLTGAVYQLSSGRYDDQIPVTSMDELGELTANFNAMTRIILRQKKWLEQNASELEAAYIDTVRLLATIIDARDNYTLGHSNRVARMSLLLGERLGLGEDELRDLEIVCMFHDVGKIKTPDSVLNKKGPLSAEEYTLMMKHTDYGAEILRVVESLRKHIPAVQYHHEWYDGSGYPEGLNGEEIPLFASIISITDSYDAMTSSRPYRAAMPREKAIKEIQKNKGRQFAPWIVDAFVEVLEVYDVDTKVKTFLGERV
jgi:HD-GYP domain-containing protein (c-di-GMP phosphodiesterase class II)